MSYAERDSAIEIGLHDFALAMAKLDEVHEELCHLRLVDERVDGPLEDLYAIRYLLS